MFVEKWMTANPHTVLPQITISAAALEMSRHKFRHLLVAEAHGSRKKLVGIVSKYDIARAFPSNYNPFSLEVTKQTVAQPIFTIMNRNVITVEPYCAIEEAARILRTRRIDALPVHRAGDLVGIITESDIFDALLSMSGANEPGYKLIIESTDVKTALASISQLSERHFLPIRSAISFHDPKLSNKVVSSFRFVKRPVPEFLQQLVEIGFRVLRVDN
ncbi:MAG TPA: CBS domain-containing protein [Terriglobales bacterium]|nr:CBS domain-containing protein [Terriglobales bacterium]